jgi:uncharacterized FlaG/YvyC family protein
MSDVDQVAAAMPVVGVTWNKIEMDSSAASSKGASESEVKSAGVTIPELTDATKIVSNIVNSVTDTNLSFSIEEELQRTVVAVRAVGSDEIIRQFPPEEFLTVAKFIAAQQMDEISEDFLKGILFDEHT